MFFFSLSLAFDTINFMMPNDTKRHGPRRGMLGQPHRRDVKPVNPSKEKKRKEEKRKRRKRTLEENAGKILLGPFLPPVIKENNEE